MNYLVVNISFPPVCKLKSTAFSKKSVFSLYSLPVDQDETSFYSMPVEESTQDSYNHSGSDDSGAEDALQQLDNIVKAPVKILPRPKT